MVTFIRTFYFQALHPLSSPMKLQIYPKLIFRTPKFSYNSILCDVWDDLKQAISISSQSFYEIIKDISSDELNELPPKIKFTIWKYFNRAKFRSTPYGTFAGFSLLTNFNKTEANEIIVENEFNLYEFVDWPEKNNIHFDFSAILNEDLIFFSNSSFYQINDSIRYIACTNGLFELAEIDFDSFVFLILETCKEKISLKALKEKLNIEIDAENDFYEFLKDLHGVQLLFNDKDENIIGEDYFNRIGYKTTSTAKYIIAEREIKSANFEFKNNSNLIELINLLCYLTPKTENNSLNEFINKFKVRFEQNELPLLQVLDPEIGIGYGKLEQAEQSDDFVAQFLNKKAKTDTDANNDFIKIWAKSKYPKTSFASIKLEEIGFNNLQQSVILPNTFSVIFSCIDEDIIIKQIGGITANALNGRFSLANDQVYNYCKELASIEINANPDVLFFDVAYLVETTVDNINRRRNIYDYQLSILNYDCSNEPLTLDDIMISVKGNEIYLRSKKYSKRLIPRIASAYNYGRSDLSVFRLLCDIQHQSVKSSLSFTLDKILPNEQFYPRVQYKNLIVSLAKWQILSSDLKKLNNASVDTWKEFLNAKGVSKYFKTGLADQTIVFSIDDNVDIDNFIKFIRGKENVWIEEVLLPKNSLIKNELGKSYLGEFIASIYHNDEIYKGLSSRPKANSKEIKTVFYPGDEWLYVEVYCHQQRADYLLGYSVFNFVSKNADKIKTWFFIRYNENGSHLRLRFNLFNKDDNQFLTNALFNLFKTELEGGLISDVLVKTYKREAERYGFDLMEDAEHVFNKDSEYVVAQIQNGLDLFAKYNQCINVFRILYANSVFSFDALKQTVISISNSFNNEHNLDTADYKKLNAQYLEYKNYVHPDLEDDLKSYQKNYASYLIKLLLKCEESKRAQLLSNMIHMHVNRIFNKDQRTHEMVIYYFLLKELYKIQALKGISN
jgi:thiopeptide-type bacteriocin biosynthesis protein